MGILYKKIKKYFMVQYYILNPIQFDLNEEKDTIWHAGELKNYKK
jgi:hypothetical protein